MAGRSGDDRSGAVLDFWFGRPRVAELRDVWFRKDEAFDAEIVRRFGGDIEDELATPGDARATPQRSLASIVVCDQFTRNAFRATPRAFAGDAKARTLAARLLDAGDDRSLPPLERAFVYMPFEHSESIADQERAARCFEVLVEQSPALQAMLDYARKHRDVIARFGRFPHRNAILGRASTAEEAEFLKQPGSRF